MHHFDDTRHVDMRISGFANGIGRQRDKGRTQMLPLPFNVYCA